MKKKEKRLRYEKFNCARLEENLTMWLTEEKKKYKTWNLFFRELKKRYVDGKTGMGGKNREIQSA